MKPLAKLAFLAAACALLVATFSIIGPSAVRAAVFTLVQVANTRTNPVLTSRIDDPGRIPYLSIVNQTGKCPVGGNTCFWEFGGVPSAHRIVIQHVSGVIGFSTAPTSLVVSLNNGSGFPVSSFFAPFTTFSAFDQQVEGYFDPGQIVEVRASMVGGTFPNPADSISEVVTLSGYELDCTVAPCAPIQH